MTITGSNFGSSQGSSTVTFNSVAATVTSWKTGAIVATVPTNATTGSVVVTVSGTHSNSVKFTVTPVIGALSPASGAVDTSVTISGSGFGASQGSSTISFNGTSAGVTSWGAASISTAVPSAAATGPVVVTVNGVASNGATFTVPPTLVSIAVAPQSASLAVGLVQQFTATGTYSDQSTNDLSQVASWSSSNTAAATVGAFGMATGRGQGSTNITATYGNANGSTTLTVTAPALTSIAITPSNSYLPQTNSEQLTATGTYSDGSTQNVTSSVTWSSSNTAVATVSAGGLTTAVSAGTTAIMAVDSGMTFSTNVAVTAQGPPTITASASPASNTAGWNNSAVTVTFTCVPGTYPIATCPAPQVVSTEGANQVVSGTVTDTNGGMATASVTVNLDLTPPALAVSNPTDGEVLTNAQLTATGTVSDALSGVASITCNQAAVTPSGGNFSCDETLNPAVNLVVVRAKDVAGNVALVEMHVTLNVPFPTPASLTVTPENVTVGVGQTQQFTAIDDQGRPRPDATWTVSNSNIATITSDASPLLRGVSVGQVTLTATVQGVQAQEEVTVTGGSLSPGAVQWSAPQYGPGYSVGAVVSAVPSENGPGLYDIDYYSPANSDYGYVAIRAFKADGQQMWQQQLGADVEFNGTTMGPDGSGGLFVIAAGMLTDLDARTGTVIWQEPFGAGGDLNCDIDEASSSFIPRNCSLGEGLSSVRPDGSLIVQGALGGAQQDGTFLFNGQTGQYTSIPLQPSSGNGSSGPNSISTDAAGNTYLTYVTTNDVATNNGDGTLTAINQQSLHLTTVGPGGAVSDQTLTQATSSEVCEPGVTYGPVSGTYLISGTVIPDGQGGQLVTWSEFPPSVFHPWGCGTGPNGIVPTEVSHLSPNGSSQYELPAYFVNQMLLGEGSTAFAASSSSTGRIFSFDVNSGQIFWSSSTYGPLLAATDDAGVVFSGVTLCSDGIHDCQNITELDSTGNPNPISVMPFMSCVPTISWNGQWLNCQNQSPAAIALPLAADPGSLWATPGGNPSVNGDSLAECGCLLETDSSNETNCPLCSLQAPNCQTVSGSGPTYLILIGDQGLDGHNVGELFALAAQTEMNTLQNQGDHVIACRASTVENVAGDLVSNGLIDGGVIYFGHAGWLRYSGSTAYYSSLFVGQQPITDDNIYVDNLNQLSNSELGSNATIVINACRAGSETPDGNPPIAALLAPQLKRTVQAYKGGMHFSNLQGNNDPTNTGGPNPSGLNMYMNPDGARPRVQPIFFYSN